ncbi:glycoside hydrolase family 3 N-terminal domain-containing protein [Amnibacterium sp.]|uniref:glycoside hydrolase family 3 N-terminal domain-containing protein n=1 Tax=Amnibacterium sp. TaxID=1872496 RepID=UPI0026141552|nr:glycoside hydrolase family 3 N-terminal domain-containing protein [Amnibacterium sp.]MCU1471998.1 nagZ [Amnibacterium sp.]
MTRGSRRARLLVPVLLAAGLLLTGCTAGASGTAPVGSSAPVRAASAPPAPAPSVSTAPTADGRAAALVAAMTPDERAGQLLMTAATVPDLHGLAAAVRRYHLAGVMIRGRSGGGTAAVARALVPVRAAAPADLPLLTATDQEGGTVQVLSGPGFSAIPSAVQQGRGSTAATRADGERWGRELARAGVRLDLAPVADVPCADTLQDNPPVANLRRQYSSDPAAAGGHVAAFIRGMAAAGVGTTVKHFPGLGCVRENTDTDRRVVDTETTVDSVRLRSFSAGLDAGAGFVMMSSAEYSRIDPGVPALFSSRIVQGLLRGRLGFTGVVMSDDLGGAAAVDRWSSGQRAVKFVRAGGDLLLDIVPADLGPMHEALVREAAADPAFSAALTAAAERVVAARIRLAG